MKFQNLNLSKNPLSSNLIYKLVFLFIITTIFPILISGYLTLEMSKQTIVNEKILKLESISNLKSLRIQENFESFKSEIDVLSSYEIVKTNLPVLNKHFGDWTNPAVLEARQQLDRELIDFQHAKIAVVDVMLINLDGKIVYNTNPEHGAKELGLELPDHDQKAFLEGQKRIYITQLFKNYLENDEPYILVSGPVFDNNDNLLGIIAFELNMDLVFSIIGDVTGLGESGESIISTTMNEKAVVLTPMRYSNVSPLSIILDFNTQNGYAISEAARGNSFSGITFGIDGEETVAVGKYIPSLDWGLVAQIDTEEAFEPIKQLEQSNILLAIIFTLVVGIVGFMASRNVALPIMRLNQSAMAVSNGNYEKTIQHNGTDELADFIKSFNNMLNQLANSDLQQKEYQAKLEHLIAKLQDVEQRKNEFASMVTHELKTPLTPILSWTNILSNGTLGDLNEKQLNAIKKIENNGIKLLDLISDVLDAQKLEIGRMTFKKSLIKTNDIVSELSNTYEQVMKQENIQFVFSDIDNVQLYTDKDRLEQALKIFITNSLDFVPTDTGRIELKIKQEDNVLKFSVIDNGIGIPEDKQPELFKKFYQIDTSATRKHGGSGLGLTIAHGISHALDGDIGVKSTQNQGSEFFITLPLTTDNLLQKVTLKS